MLVSNKLDLTFFTTGIILFRASFLKKVHKENKSLKESKSVCDLYQSMPGLNAIGLDD